jgi:hypothetical protein
MASTSGVVTVKVGADTSRFEQTCRTIARHLTALADELAFDRMQLSDIELNYKFPPEVSDG